MTVPLSFLGSENLKAVVVARLSRCITEDRLLRYPGYWIGGPDPDGRGGAVAATLGGEFPRHEGPFPCYPEKLGFPIAFAHIEQTIYEGLSPNAARKFPLKFVELTPVGKNLYPVVVGLLRTVLINPDDGMIKQAQTHHQEQAVKHIADLLGRSQVYPGQWANAVRQAVNLIPIVDWRKAAKLKPKSEARLCGGAYDTGVTFGEAALAASKLQIRDLIRTEAAGNVNESAAAAASRALACAGAAAVYAALGDEEGYLAGKAFYHAAEATYWAGMSSLPPHLDSKTAKARSAVYRRRKYKQECDFVLQALGAA